LNSYFHTTSQEGRFWLFIPNSQGFFKVPDGQSGVNIYRLFGIGPEGKNGLTIFFLITKAGNKISETGISNCKTYIF